VQAGVGSEMNEGHTTAMCTGSLYVAQCLQQQRRKQAMGYQLTGANQEMSIAEMFQQNLLDYSVLHCQSDDLRSPAVSRQRQNEGYGADENGL
jgi:hypothetical protein